MQFPDCKLYGPFQGFLCKGRAPMIIKEKSMNSLINLHLCLCLLSTWTIGTHLWWGRLLLSKLWISYLCLNVSGVNTGLSSIFCLCHQSIVGEHSRSAENALGQFMIEFFEVKGGVNNDKSITMSVILRDTVLDDTRRHNKKTGVKRYYHSNQIVCTNAVITVSWIRMYNIFIWWTCKRQLKRISLFLPLYIILLCIQYQILLFYLSIRV